MHCTVEEPSSKVDIAAASVNPILEKSNLVKASAAVDQPEAWGALEPRLCRA